MSNQVLALVSVGATVVVTIANIFLVVLTRRYVRLTAEMLEHMRSSQAASVVIDLTFDGHSSYLTVANTGTLAATDIVFDSMSGMEWAEHGNIETVRQNGISYLPAGRTLRFWLGYPNWEKIQAEHAVMQIDLQYRVDERVETRQFIVDMSQYLGTSAESAPEDRIVEAIERLEDARRLDRIPFSASFMNPKKQCCECAEAIPTAAKRCSKCGAVQMSEAPKEQLTTSEAGDRDSHGVYPT